MERDKEGFFYPVAEEAACINCDRCNRVCPAQKPLPVDDKEPLCYAAISQQDRQRAQSSSGGVFYLLAEKVLEQGGAVYGAAMEPDLTVRHLRITHTEELFRLMGSKYVQSRMGDCFTGVRLDLEQGRKVLFSGTGCQVQGLLGYLGGPKPRLLTVDVICHGVPSEAVWQAYAKAIGAQRRRGTSLGADPIGSTTERRTVGVGLSREPQCGAFCFGAESTGCVLCRI